MDTAWQADDEVLSTPTADVTRLSFEVSARASLEGKSSIDIGRRWRASEDTCRSSVGTGCDDDAQSPVHTSALNAVGRRRRLKSLLDSLSSNERPQQHKQDAGPAQSESLLPPGDKAV